MIPQNFRYTMEGSTPSFADNEGQTIESKTQVRLRIKGIRSELGQMYAIGSIREDYLGYATQQFVHQRMMLMALQSSLAIGLSLSILNCTTIVDQAFSEALDLSLIHI